MSIATSIEKLSETLTNCKTNLKEKKVENVDNIKIGDVDEKIAEIQAGGGEADYSGLYSEYIQKVEVKDSTNSEYQEVKFGEKYEARYTTGFAVKVTLNTDAYLNGFTLNFYTDVNNKNVGYACYQKEFIEFDEGITLDRHGSVYNVFLFPTNPRTDQKSMFYFTIREPSY